MANVIFTLLNGKYDYQNPAAGLFLFEQRPLSDPVFPGGTIFPGGKIESGETPTEAFLREVGEEIRGVFPTEWGQWELPYLYHAPNRYPYFYPEEGVERAKRPWVSETSIPGWEDFRCYLFIVRRWDGIVPDYITDEHAPYPIRWMRLDDPLIQGGCMEEIKSILRSHRETHTRYIRSGGS